MMRYVFFIALLMIAKPFAANPIDTAKEAIAALNAATASLSSADATEDRVNALAETIRAYELALAAARDGIRLVTIRERALQLELDGRREEISRLLGVLQTLERATTPLLLIHPTGAVGTARGGMMLAEVTPGLQEQANRLGAQLNELNQLQLTQEIAQAEMSEAFRELSLARTQLSQAISAREPLPEKFAEEAEGLRILAESVSTLEEFTLLFENVLPDGADETTRFSDEIGNIPLPVSGSIFRRYNEADAAGTKRPGILISTEPLALVSSPWNATVRFTGDVLDYGNVIILEPQTGYLIVLAGVTMPFVDVGEVVKQNDPLGILNAGGIEFGEKLIEVTPEAEALDRETLYIEIRESGQTTDPEDWFKLTASEG